MWISDQHLPSDVKDSGKSPPLNKLPKSLTHDQHETSYNSPSHNTISVQLTEDSAEDIKQLVENVKKTSDATDTSQDVPVYAVPDKTKRKVNLAVYLFIAIWYILLTDF